MKFHSLVFLSSLLFSLSAKSQIVSIPYQDNMKVPVITLGINGGTYRFIFDMGAEVSIINSKYITLPQTGKIKVDDANNASKTLYKSKVESLVLGANKEIAFSNVNVYSTEMNEQVFTCNEIAGILGMDLLGSYVIELDPANKIISFYKDSPIDKKEMLPFGKKGNRPSVDVMINNQVINLLLDSGSAGFIKLSDKAGLKFDSDAAQKMTGYSGLGLYGRKEGVISSEVIKADVSVGGTTDHNQVILIEPTNSSKLGFEYMKHFKVIVSVKDRMLALKKIEDFQYTDMLLKFGFLIGIDKGGYVITKKNVSRMDVEIGDKVISVNEQALGDLCDINKVKELIEKTEVAPGLLIERGRQRLRISQ
ncbi:aspartyl protease family protein [Chitinophaga sancti]|uniref:Aspartyl protease n=1 Tax=Chitinophaga sancti TaxID=1004 RepID=A0A1K1RWU4_9BACT|nr:aspartyl protease family protein [Chitinophaga sancti]WQD64033.1 aspartyl protease family protein [Chitinophaga sancti]WQG90343.1 aspartyl protease family protein [Chitinophaga sancti]SFW76640.1 Aspartyl protease [Chitinophaga sancti]